jgi:hypothetical protein
MPRRSKPPQALQIEALSTGQRVDLVDDFTGQPILRATKPRMTSAEIRAIAKERDRLAQLSVLVDAGLGNRVGYAREQPKPTPKHNQVFTESGLVITVPRSLNAFKRRF